ncbi:beta-glucosidase [Mucilaginibacter sp. BT774]|uniref:beta-glucosidase family protein n=1 Tax=Mucilaginibacter sp. BT774 TaxID=3062276 RepID=UPI002674C638|nr:glycoside hydrolase family 3 C-terminal domain-containing protein [Mucilaginibacter sp. BT774]MDO3627198.1 glycoside hydrolase family 3 C-terminal domain-containing protein [Mucilaginibacter sp. BT774]
MKKLFFMQIVVAATLVAGQSAFGQEKEPQFGKDPIKEIVKKMTLEEKVRVVVGKGFSVPGLSMGAVDNTPDKLAAISGHTIANPKFGIPSIGMADGPAGIHRFAMSKQDSVDNLFSTAWPVGTLLASSWDTAMVKKVGVAFGEEIKAYGIDFILGPGVNIHRNPLGGRNFEYYSEDPLVSGTTAAAIINGIQSQGVGATIKHFAANNQETNRNSVNEIISERALREIYLRNFEIAIKRSHPWAVMSSYNLVNGTYTSESRDLLTKVLREDWGYKGFVMSDWFGGKDAAAQINAGNNLLMPGTPAQVKAILEAVKSGKLSEAEIDKNVEGVLNVLVHTITAKGYAYPNKADLKGHAQISREAAAESMVLLKNNENALPVKKSDATIALFGNHGYDLIAGGTGSGDVNKLYAVSLAEGLTNAGYKLDNDLAQNYKNYLADYSSKHPKKPLLQELMNPTPFAPEYKFDSGSVGQKADASDVAIIYIGRNAGEGNDRKVANDYDLTSLEKEMITSVSDAFHAKHKPVIAVLNIGGVMDVTAFRDKVDAILLAWQPGEEGGNAIADVLSGKVNPSGKLATTFPASYSDVPSAKTFPGKEFPEKATMTVVGRSVPAEVTYQEGIYVGYRYFNTFKVKPAYEFGYGLSYTNFSYSNLTLSSTAFSGKLTATVIITNKGSVAGKEVAELYLSAPHKSLDKPSEELKGFAKTKVLKPGESQTLTFTLDAKSLASFDTAQSAWIADAGEYKVKVGASSENIKLEKPFSLATSITVEKVHKALAPLVSIDEAKSK